MLRVVVVDDEPLARQAMRQLLAEQPSVTLVGEAGSVKAAAELIERERPDAVFLDIEMHSAKGFDLVTMLDHPPDIVFVTAHSQYALQAYDVSALDYLLKPVRPDRLASAIAKLKRSHQARRVIDQSETPAVLRLKTGTKTSIIRVEEIVALRAEGDYTMVLVDKTPSVLAGESIGRLESLLPKASFVRLGRSLIINIDRLREIEVLDRDSTRIRLDGYTETFVLGRAAAAQLKKAQAGAKP